LEAAHSVGRRDLALGEVSLPNGTVFRNVQIDTNQDARQSTPWSTKHVPVYKLGSSLRL